MQVLLTHDIDKTTEKRGHIWKVRKRFSKKDLLKGFFIPRCLYWNVKEIMKLEERFGFRSTFFLSTELYSLDDISKECRELAQKGWEIGYHMVYTDEMKKNNPVKFLRKKREDLEKIAGSRIFGIRNHFLIHYGEETFSLQKNAGFLYDSTLRASEFGFKPYQPLEKFYEIPFTIMDTDLWGRWKMSEAEGWKYIKKTLKEVEKANGVFVFNAHQCSYHMRGGRLYRNLLEEIARKEYSVIKVIDLIKSLDGTK